MTTPDDDLDMYVRRVAMPYGGAADRRAAQIALQQLLAAPEAAHPRLLALVGLTGQPNPVTVIAALPQFGRAESVPVLAELLAGGRDNVRLAAADALARHPLAAAGAALRAALAADDAKVVRAAADGLRV